MGMGWPSGQVERRGSPSSSGPHKNLDRAAVGSAEGRGQGVLASVEGCGQEVGASAEGCGQEVGVSSEGFDQEVGVSACCTEAQEVRCTGHGLEA